MEIIHLDNQLVVVNKPANLLVHRSAIDRHETQFALQQIRNLLKRKVYPVHRLDKTTSGALLFALTQESARRLTELFTQGAVEKTYLAIVRGYTKEQGEINYSLSERLDPIVDAKANQAKLPQAAITQYHRLNYVELPVAVGRYTTARFCLLKIQPKTGRKHQIRRHMKHIFHPIIGDTTYGDGRQNIFFREHLACHRLLLAAVSLAFIHPFTAEYLKVNAPLDMGFGEVLAKLGWPHPEYSI